MALFFRGRQQRLSTVEGPPVTDPYGDRVRRIADTMAVSGDTALRHSAVWGALRLRADLVSTMPLEAFRHVSGVSVELARPPMLTFPGGEHVNIHEWLY